MTPYTFQPVLRHYQIRGDKRRFYKVWDAMIDKYNLKPIQVSAGPPPPLTTLKPIQVAAGPPPPSIVSSNINENSYKRTGKRIEDLNNDENKVMLQAQTNRALRKLRKTICLYDMHPETSQDLLYELLKNFGKVLDIQDVAIENEEGIDEYSHSMIRFADQEAAETAIVTLNNTLFNHTIIYCNWSKYELMDSSEQNDNSELENQKITNQYATDFYGRNLPYVF